MKNLRSFFIVFFFLSSSTLFSLTPHFEKLVNVCKTVSYGALKIGQTIKQRGEIIKSCLSEIGDKPVLRVRHVALFGAGYLAYKNRARIGRFIGRCVDSVLSSAIRLGSGTYYYLYRLGFVRGISNYSHSFEDGGHVHVNVDDDHILDPRPVRSFEGTRPSFSSSIPVRTPPSTDDHVPLASRVEAYSEQEHDGQCTICLDGYSAEREIRRLGCGHYLHDACFQGLVAHIDRNDPDLRCMVCRAPVVNPFPAAF